MRASADPVEDWARRRAVLRAVLAASVLSTAIHYTDNAIAIGEFEGPGWISRPLVVAAWFLFTAVGLLAYRLYGGRRTWLAHACLVVYSYAGLTSVGHFLDLAPADLSLNHQLFVWTDFVTGAAVLAFALWSALHAYGQRPLAGHRATSD